MPCRICPFDYREVTASLLLIACETVVHQNNQNSVMRGSYIKQLHYFYIKLYIKLQIHHLQDQIGLTHHQHDSKVTEKTHTLWEYRMNQYLSKRNREKCLKLISMMERPTQETVYCDMWWREKSEEMFIYR